MCKAEPGWIPGRGNQLATEGRPWGESQLRSAALSARVRQLTPQAQRKRGMMSFRKLLLSAVLVTTFMVGGAGKRRRSQGVETALALQGKRLQAETWVDVRLGSRRFRETDPLPREMMHVSDPPNSAVKWSSWNSKQAVGVGLARSSGCPMGGQQKGKCELGYPWNGTHLKVVAWRPVSGHFTRMKIFTPRSQSSKRFYALMLAFRGPFVPDRTVSWTTIRTVRGTG